MSSITSLPAANGFTPPPRNTLPDHTQLPDSDGLPVENFIELPQSILLTNSLLPVLRKLHPDDQFAVGQNSGIYFKPTDPPLEGCLAPDWYYVPNVPPMLVGGQKRRSYVMWKELKRPLLVMEFVSRDGSIERDRTPWTGKFWIYEQAVRAGYYVIFDPERQIIEAYQLKKNRYESIPANEHGRYPIAALGIEFGIWHGHYVTFTMGWMRAWDAHGEMLPIPEERLEGEKQRAKAEKQIAKAERQRAKVEKQRAEAEKQRAEVEKQRAEAEKQRADRLAAQLRALGHDPDKIQ